MNILRQFIGDQVKFLLFQPITPDLRRYYWHYLLFGLVITWACGVGRYWDDLDAAGWQTLGLGSVCYVFLLALILWCIIRPLRPSRWGYRNVLLFVVMTSPPAMIYAIPVERYADVDTAISLNLVALSIVSVWRVALLVRFLWKVADLGPVLSIVSTLFPISVIVVAIFSMNLEEIVVNNMGGFRERPPNANDGVNGMLGLMAILSIFLSPVLLVIYALGVLHRRDKFQREGVLHIPEKSRDGLSSSEPEV